MSTGRGMDCNVLVELVTEYLEGTLDARERARLEEHLRICDGCEAYIAQVRDAVRLTGRLSSADLDPAMAPRLLAAFRAWKAGRDPST